MLMIPFRYQREKKSLYFVSSAEIGDIDKLEDYLGENGSLADLKMFENMTPRVEAKIREIYKSIQ